MFQALISPIASLAGTWLQGRVDKAKAETEVKVAKARAEAKVYETEATSSFLNEQALTNLHFCLGHNHSLKKDLYF